LNGDGGSNIMAESTLAESLTRLELNSLQLKIYLDSIDQRISRMEPRLENVAPTGLSTAPLHTREEGAARFSAIVPPAPDSAETVPAEAISAAAIEPQLPPNDPHVLNEPDRGANAGGAATGPAAMLARLRTGWQEFYSSRRQGVLPTLVGVVMVLIAASLFWSFGRDTGYAVVNPVNASMTGAANAGGISAAPRAASSVGDRSAGGAGGSQVAGVSDPSAAPGGSAPGRRSQGGDPASAHSDTSRGVSRPVDAPTPSSNAPAKTPARTSLLSGPPVSGSPSSESAAADGAMSSPEAAADTSDVEAPPVRTYRLSSAPSSNHLVNVSSGIMAANLLSSPKPSYPTLASLTRTQGNVVMQAVISKSGTVEHLHVIKGHHLLRGAAKSAVRNWRYRPYKIGGVPVEVATIVSVDFSLHR
jgi:TonB family protein